MYSWKKLIKKKSHSREKVRLIQLKLSRISVPKNQFSISKENGFFFRIPSFPHDHARLGKNFRSRVGLALIFFLFFCCVYAIGGTGLKPQKLGPSARPRGRNAVLLEKTIDIGIRMNFPRRHRTRIVAPDSKEYFSQKPHIHYYLNLFLFTISFLGVFKKIYNRAYSFYYTYV